MRGVQLLYVCAFVLGPAVLPVFVLPSRASAADGRGNRVAAPHWDGSSEGVSKESQGKPQGGVPSVADGARGPRQASGTAVGKGSQARVTYVSEIKFQESLQAFKKGNYRNAMLGFMDVVIEEPENVLARDYLRESGRLVLEMGNKNIQLQRKNLLYGAEMMKKRLFLFKESKEAKVRNWDTLFSSVTSLAGDPDSFFWAVLAYEKFVRETPVYAELRDKFSERVKIINGIFYTTAKNRYPDLVGGRADIDQADLAATFITRDALSYRHVNIKQADDILAKSARIKYLQSGLSALFNDETYAMRLYLRGEFTEADALFKKVLKVWGTNEEAAFYSGLAAGRIAAANALARPSASAAGGLQSAPVAAKLALPPAALPPPREPKSTGKGTGVQEHKSTRAQGAEALPPKTASAPRAAPAGSVPRPADAVTGGLPAAPVAAKLSLPAVAEPGKPDGDTEALLAADKLYEQGVREFSLENYSAAAKSWGECLRLNPDHSKARLGIKRLKSSGG